MPTVSIIVPNYNHAIFLQQRLDSIFNQSFQDFEVILLDDASTDYSLDILKKYAQHPKVSHFIVNEENSGSPFRQWQKGLSLAQGKYVWIAESDDWADLKFLEQLVDVLEKNEQIGLVYAHSLEVDQKGKEVGERWYVKNEKNAAFWKSSFQMNGINFLKQFLAEINVIPNASAVLFRKNVLDLSDMRAFHKRKTGDWWIWSSIALKSDVAFIAKPLNYFRSHAASTRVYRSKQERKLRILEGIELLNFITDQTNISKHRLREISKKLGGRWQKIYLNAKSIDLALFFPPFLQEQRLAYYFGFFAPQKKYYFIPYMLLLPMRLLYLNLKK
ncbi:MAG: glycosyltransferase [Bacteroidota bacterium]